MQAARGLSARLNVDGVICLRQAAKTGSVPRCVVRIVDPAAFGIEQMRRLVDGKQRTPIGCWIAAVYRLRPIELRISFGNKISVEIRDVSVGVGEDRVVRGVRMQLHRLPE